MFEYFAVLRVAANSAAEPASRAAAATYVSAKKTIIIIFNINFISISVMIIIFNEFFEGCRLKSP